MQIGKTDCPSVQMSFNTMLEGFERHAATTGQENPMEMMRKQNEAIQTDLQRAGEERVRQQLEALRRKNAEQEAELERTKAELLNRQEFYEQNAPPQVVGQLPEIFGDLAAKDARFKKERGKREAKIEEVADDFEL